MPTVAATKPERCSTNWCRPSKASSGGFTYDYGVVGGRDIVRDLAESCAAHGVKLGIYYSVNANEYLNYANGVRDPSTLQPGQERVTQGEYNSVVLQQLDELWSQYGRLAEIWFDVSAKALSAKRVASPHGSPRGSPCFRRALSVVPEAVPQVSL